VFDIVVAIIFQSVICLEMHQNNNFFIFLKLFLTSVHQNVQKKHKKNKFKEKNNF
jgi:hypothetical protein